MRARRGDLAEHLRSQFRLRSLNRPLLSKGLSQFASVWCSCREAVAHRINVFKDTFRDEVEESGSTKNVGKLHHYTLVFAQSQNRRTKIMK